MTKRDFETLYYEQQAEYTEERGMLAQERDMWRDRAEAAERELAEACLSIANEQSRAHIEMRNFRRALRDLASVLQEPAASQLLDILYPEVAEK